MKITNNSIINKCWDCKNMTCCTVYMNPNYEGSMDSIHPDCPLRDVEVIDPDDKDNGVCKLWQWEYSYCQVDKDKECENCGIEQIIIVKKVK